MRISDWSADVCASERRALLLRRVVQVGVAGQPGFQRIVQALRLVGGQLRRRNLVAIRAAQVVYLVTDVVEHNVGAVAAALLDDRVAVAVDAAPDDPAFDEPVVEDGNAVVSGESVYISLDNGCHVPTIDTN